MALLYWWFWPLTCILLLLLSGRFLVTFKYSHFFILSVSSLYITPLISLQRHNKLTIRWQQTLALPHQPEPMSMLITPNYLLLGERNMLRVWAFQFTQMKTRKTTKKTSGEEQEKKEDDDRVWSVPIEGILSGKHYPFYYCYARMTATRIQSSLPPSLSSPPLPPHP